MEKTTTGKSLGEIVGDLVGILLYKDILTVEEVKTIFGEYYFNMILEKSRELEGEES